VDGFPYYLHRQSLIPLSTLEGVHQPIYLYKIPDTTETTPIHHNLLSRFAVFRPQQQPPCIYTDLRKNTDKMHPHGNEPTQARDEAVETSDHNLLSIFGTFRHRVNLLVYTSTRDRTSRQESVWLIFEAMNLLWQGVPCSRGDEGRTSFRGRESSRTSHSFPYEIADEYSVFED